MQLFVDMDGVLADFDGHHETVFGIRSDKALDNVRWDRVHAVNGFYRDLPPMPDMHELWDRIAHHNPIVLTGVPTKVPAAADDKRAWARKHLGDHVEVRCCRSVEKCLHARPGDILIDDWEKYRALWVGAGGVWITHLSAGQTADELTRLGL
jgi:5'(3')-deoxyribonucleotidase